MFWIHVETHKLMYNMTQDIAVDTSLTEHCLGRVHSWDCDGTNVTGTRKGHSGTVPLYKIPLEDSSASAEVTGSVSGVLVVKSSTGGWGISDSPAQHKTRIKQQEDKI